MDFDIPVVIQFDSLCWYLLHLMRFSGKCRWYHFCIKFSNIWYDALGSVIRSASKCVWMFRLRKSERYWSSDDSVIDILYTYLGGLGFLFNILKLTTHGKWSEIPLRSIEAEISACSLQGTLQNIWFKIRPFGNTSGEHNLGVKIIRTHYIEEIVIFFSFIDLKKIDIKIARYRGIAIFFFKLIYNWRHFINEGFDICVIVIVMGRPVNISNG